MTESKKLARDIFLDIWRLFDVFKNYFRPLTPAKATSASPPGTPALTREIWKILLEVVPRNPEISATFSTQTMINAYEQVQRMNG